MVKICVSDGQESANPECHSLDVEADIEAGRWIARCEGFEGMGESPMEAVLDWIKQNRKNHSNTYIEASFSEKNDGNSKKKTPARHSSSFTAWFMK